MEGRIRPKYNNSKLIRAWVMIGLHTPQDIVERVGISQNTGEMLAAGRRLPHPEVIGRTLELAKEAGKEAQMEPLVDAWAKAFEKRERAVRRMSVAHTGKEHGVPTFETREKMSAAWIKPENFSPKTFSFLSYLAYQAETFNLSGIAEKLRVSSALLSQIKHESHPVSERFMDRVLAIFPPGTEEAKEALKAFWKSEWEKQGSKKSAQK